MWKNLTSLICIVSFLTAIFPTQSFSGEGIFLNLTSARKVVTELKYCDLTKQRLDICQKQYSTIRTLNTSNEKLVAGLTKDKIDLNFVANDFEQKLIEKNKQLTDLRESQPSRVVWYGAGVITALVLGLAAAFLSK